MYPAPLEIVSIAQPDSSFFVFIVRLPILKNRYCIAATESFLVGGLRAAVPLIELEKVFALLHEVAHLMKVTRLGALEGWPPSGN